MIDTTPNTIRYSILSVVLSCHRD